MLRALKRYTLLVISICLSLIVIHPGLPVAGQTNQCTTTKNTAAFRGAAFAWPQNALVTVNINADQFSQGDLYCLQTAFENWNLANESSGNSSGVRFRLTRTSTPIAATVGGTAETAPTSAAPTTYVYQVNRPATLEGNAAAFAETGAGDRGLPDERGNKYQFTDD